jgi:hypothetical protein
LSRPSRSGIKTSGRRRWTTQWLLLVGLALLSACESTPAPSPRSDWADVVLQATGTGGLDASAGSPVEERVLAIQAAKVDAYQKLEGEILRLKMDEKQTVSQFLEKKPKLGEKVRDYVRGARIVSTRVIADRAMEVDAELFLGENFRAVLGLIEKRPSSETGPGKNKAGSGGGRGEELFR